jgi:hypothetical protein
MPGADAPNPEKHSVDRTQRPPFPSIAEERTARPTFVSGPSPWPPQLVHAGRSGARAATAVVANLPHEVVVGHGLHVAVIVGGQHVPVLKLIRIRLCQPLDTSVIATSECFVSSRQYKEVGWW